MPPLRLQGRNIQILFPAQFQSDNVLGNFEPVDFSKVIGIVPHHPLRRGLPSIFFEREIELSVIKNAMHLIQKRVLSGRGKVTISPFIFKLV